jgi:hypothetical protein
MVSSVMGSMRSTQEIASGPLVAQQIRLARVAQHHHGRGSCVA